MLTRYRSDVWAALVLLLLPIVFFWPVTVGGQTMLPADNLYQYLPWQAQAEALGVAGQHNPLLSDLILENYPWKSFIVDSLRGRQLPLWNPYVFGGAPFLAAGQHSALYPLSILYYLLPLMMAFGLFSALTFFLAGLSMYVFVRVLGAPPWGGLVAGVTYAFSGFFVVSVVFPMIIGAATWLPLLLAIVELLARRRPGRAALLIAGGAVLVGVQFFAGHVELSYYNMMVLGFYALARAVLLWREQGKLQPAFMLLAQVGVLTALGVGLAGVQIAPLFELVRTSFRQGSASYGDVVGWAYPLRQIVTFLIPDFFGNPSHHSYVDVVERTVTTVTRDYHGQPISSIFWGIKNYVEAGSYVGVLPLLLAGLTVLRRLPRSGVFALLAVLSLLFAFGTPLYALLFYGLPGYSQLHSAFRWVYPYTLSVAVLAGLAFCDTGAVRRGDAETRGHGDAGTWGRAETSAVMASASPHLPVVGSVVLAAGLLGLAVLGMAVVAPGPFVRLADAFVARSDLAQTAFRDGQMFLSYQWRNLLIFFAALAGSGLVLLAARRGWRLWPAAALAVVVGELFVIGSGFYPRSDTRWLNATPPSVAFLTEDKDIFRIATLDLPDQKLFNANGPMLYRLQDVRGYDSIIPRRYTEFMGMIEGQGELLYNRIAPFYWAGSLDSRLVDLLNVKYVLTTQRLGNRNWTLVYDGEVLIYRNDDVLPRAFVVEQARVIEDEATLRQAMLSFDPQREVLLEQPLWRATNPSSPQQAGTMPALQQRANIVSYTPNRVTLRAALPRPGYLVLLDSYFPGWIAEARPAGDAEAAFQTIPIQRANWNFRAVALAEGEWEIVFRYSPLSLRVGLLASVLSLVMLLLIGATTVWGRLYRDEDEQAGAVRRVAKNSLLPMIANLTGRIIDLGFAIVVVRTLGAEGQGRFALAIAFIGYFDIFTNFGLNVLLTREVARDRNKANFYLSNTIGLRLLLWLLSLPLIAGYLYVMKLPWDTSWAIVLFTLGLVPSNIAAALSSVFNAYEKMEYPAAVTVLTTVLKVAVGSAVLLAGWGIVGLAGASVFVNMGTALILIYPLYTRFFRPRIEFDLHAALRMLVESYPLMINHFLATLFFRIDALLMKPLLGGVRADAALGYYSTAYKFIDGLNIIPSYLTLAIFPLMSRYAHETGDAMRRAYVLTLRLLMLLALPLSTGTFLLADRIILFFFGAKMLPESGQALALLIWFLPFSFINSVTQYALIAVNQQRFLTRAFLIGAAFNVVTNLLLIPRYGFLGAAVTTVMSEFILFLPFYYAVRQHITSLPFVEIFWRPIAASAIMGAVIWLGRDLHLLLMAPLGLVVYAIAIVAIGGISRDDWELVRRARR